MILTAENIILIGSILLFLSIVFGKATFKFGVPTLILFLTVGMLAGEDGFGIAFEDPKIAQFIGVVALNFILFSGGLDTNWKSVKPIWKQSAMLSTVGVMLTAFTLGGLVYMVTNFTLYESLLLGSIVSSTDAAAVFSILRSRSVSLRENIRPTLEFESGSNDPMAYVLTILFLGLVVNQDQSFVSVIPVFFQQMIVGAVCGFGFGFLSKWVINKINLDFDGLYPVLVIALMFITFSATDVIGGNGFLAIYISGVYLGNQKFIQKASILKIYDGLAWLMQIILFLTLGLLVNPSEIIPLMGIGLLISLSLILIARPVGVFVSLSFFKMRMRRRLFISWVGLRGAVPIVFATYPLMAGIEEANMIFNIVFFISVTSVLIQGTTLSVVAKWLNVAVPEKDKQISDTEKIKTVYPKPLLRDFKISGECPAADHKIVDLKLPETMEIVMVKRDGSYFSSNGNTVIRSGDVLKVLAEKEEDFENLRTLLRNY